MCQGLIHKILLQSLIIIFLYSWRAITWTFKGNWNSLSYWEFKANNQKWGNRIREECKYHEPFTTRAARDKILIFWAWLISTAPNIVFELDWQKSKETIWLFGEKFNVLDCSSLRIFDLKHGLSYEARG